MNNVAQTIAFETEETEAGPMSLARAVDARGHEITVRRASLALGDRTDGAAIYAADGFIVPELANSPIGRALLAVYDAAIVAAAVEMPVLAAEAAE